MTYEENIQQKKKKYEEVGVLHAYREILATGGIKAPENDKEMKDYLISSNGAADIWGMVKKGLPNGGHHAN